MLKSVSTIEFTQLGVKTRFGPDWPGKRCLAKNRKGNPCQCPAMKGQSRCRLHGGLSTGPKTVAGRARVVAANWKHGWRSREHVEKVKAINAELRWLTNQLKLQGLID